MCAQNRGTKIMPYLVIPCITWPWSPIRVQWGSGALLQGPIPTILDFVYPNPVEFAWLWMAQENILPANATKRFSFQILLDHLKLLIVDSCSNFRFPYTNTMDALNQQYGQLALQRIAELMGRQLLISGDTKTFRMFGLKVRSLVSMLSQLRREGIVEMECGSHVSRLLEKLTHGIRSSFQQWHIHPQNILVPTLRDFSHMLENELWKPSCYHIDEGPQSRKMLSLWQATSNKVPKDMI